MTNETPDLGLLEAQVLVLVAQGRTNAQIRAELGLSPHILARLLGRLYRKSGVYMPSQPYTPAELRRRLAEWGRTTLPG
jgi:DNA-binding NarL/FixJ family response regulator